MMEKITTMLIGILLALAGWSLSRTFELSTSQAVLLNKVNIEFLTKQMEKVLVDIEKLKDSNRDMKYNGNGTSH